ncbi:hypothetical protein LZ198_26515 [Myxococcus sp. K15C18031901]|uniref:hypothetical protein n=1 Tax=Myxococcus dinghuensis TaxID=2906761 RepID=UPI0020A7B04A|nr:hypothetical protein [Myxococcus dinghuensis]MCP3102431.1 hypothetical protein [Myxococcus dinghuensis]
MSDNLEPRPEDVLPTDAEWERLTVVPGKRDAYVKDLYFRETWADVAERFGDQKLSLLHSVAVMNVKPDAVVGRRMKPILEFVTRHGFLPIGCAPFQLTRHSMRDVWRYDWHVYPVDRLTFSTLWYTEVDILLFVLQDLRPQGALPASVRLAQLKGSSVPEKRTAGDMRTLLRPPNRFLNFTHVQDEPADIVRELGIFFDRPERRALLRDIERNLGVDRSADVLAAIDRLEARYPAHDLDFEASLQRLERASAVSADNAAKLRALRAAGGRTGWEDLCAMIDRSAPGAGRWDFIAVVSTVLWYERPDPVDLLPAVDASRWTRTG